MRWRPLMVAAVIAAALVPAGAARAAPAQTPEQAAGRGAVDYQQGEMHLGADNSSSDGGATVGAEAAVRLDALTRVGTGGDDGRRTSAGPDHSGGGGGGSNAGAPYRCRYVETGRQSRSGLIEMTRHCGTAARTGLGGGWYQTLDTVFVDPAAPPADPEAPPAPPPLVDPAVLAAVARSTEHCSTIYVRRPK
jgi:hypothetical protein